MTGWSVLFFVAVILATIGATLSAVAWLAKEALALIVTWALGWDKHHRESGDPEEIDV